MSIYNNLTTNNIELRAKDIILDELHVKNPATGDYDRVLPGGGGGGPSDLPYWALPTEIDMGNIVIDPETGVTFGDAQGNETINAASIREERSTLLSAVSSIEQIDEDLQTTKEDLDLVEADVIALNTKTAGITRGVSATFINNPSLRSGPVSMWVDGGGVNLSNGTSNFTLLTTTQLRFQIAAGVTAQLTYEKLKKLDALNENLVLTGTSLAMPNLVASTGKTKLLAFDPTTKAITHQDIPTEDASKNRLVYSVANVIPGSTPAIPTPYSLLSSASSATTQFPSAVATTEPSLAFIGGINVCRYPMGEDIVSFDLFNRPIRKNNGHTEGRTYIPITLAPGMEYPIVSLCDYNQGRTVRDLQPPGDYWVSARFVIAYVDGVSGAQPAIEVTVCGKSIGDISLQGILTLKLTPSTTGNVVVVTPSPW